MVEGFDDIPRADVGIRPYVITRTSNARPYGGCAFAECRGRHSLQACSDRRKDPSFTPRFSFGMTVLKNPRTKKESLAALFLL